MLASEGHFSLYIHVGFYLKNIFQKHQSSKQSTSKRQFQTFFAYFSAAGSENTVLADHLHPTEAHLAMLEWWGLLPRWRVWDCRKNIYKF